MRKRFFFLLALSFFLIGVSTLAKTPKITINNHSFNLYIAKSSRDKEIGLAKYSNLPQNQGMLFPFGTASYYSFWMKDMKFPIDIIFIGNNRIVAIYQNLQPPQKDQNPAIYRPEKLSDTVLEINAGLSEKYNFKKGDFVKIENP
ncbi:MAG: DUF192 domain-containing protein [Candidatus Levybacteria bacterium]|nr:DUF192 domain-containing protein [Candidatus Levybacteria bacterium]